MEFIVRDNEDNALENVVITVKMGEKVLAEKMKTSSEGKFELTSQVYLGDELTVEFLLEPDHAKVVKEFKVGEPEDNTHDKDNLDTNTFTKYLQLAKTNVKYLDKNNWQSILS